MNSRLRKKKLTFITYIVTNIMLEKQPAFFAPQVDPAVVGGKLVLEDV